MNFKKLQLMQEKLDQAILSVKAKMTVQERFNKTLVAFSVEVAEVANCSEHFKFWKDNKGKVDEKRFRKINYSDWPDVYEDWGKHSKESPVTFGQAHKITLVEEASDCLHFILSLANQMNFQCKGYYGELEEGETAESIFLNLMFQISVLQMDNKRYFDSSDKATMQIIINIYFEYIEKLGITTQELEQAYYEKNEENYRRLESGY